MRLPTTFLLITLLAGCGVASPATGAVKAKDGWFTNVSFEYDFTVRAPREGTSGGTAVVTFYERRTEGFEPFSCLAGCPDPAVSERLAVSTSVALPALAPGTSRRFRAEAYSQDDPWKSERQQIRLLGSTPSFDYRAEVTVNWHSRYLP